MKATRTHDKKVYLKEKRKNKPKEYFKFTNSLCSDYISQIVSPQILDIGCATGDFLYYLSQKYPNASLTGMDVVPELLKVGEKEVKHCRFIKGDISKKSQLPKNKFDIIFMMGVHGLFDEYSHWIDNICKLLTKKGRAYIFGTFNDENVDVINRIKLSDKDLPYELGWNTWSKKTISTYLNKIKIKHYFTDFDIKIDIKKDKNDPMRTYSIKLKTGKRILINGAGMIRSLKMLTFSKSKF